MYFTWFLFIAAVSTEKIGSRAQQEELSLPAAFHSGLYQPSYPLPPISIGCDVFTGNTWRLPANKSPPSQASDLTQTSQRHPKEFASNVEYPESFVEINAEAGNKAREIKLEDVYHTNRVFSMVQMALVAFLFFVPMSTQNGNFSFKSALDGLRSGLPNFVRFLGFVLFFYVSTWFHTRTAPNRTFEFRDGFVKDRYPDPRYRDDYAKGYKWDGK